jgi:SAM-dependent methyltransferase/catechol 2,3-dioxygenase-like lactoylglutathione lyase family enzyme
METDLLHRRYRLSQRLDLRADTSGGMVVWLPSKKMFSPLPLKALIFLSAFGEPVTAATACEKVEMGFDDEVREALSGYVSLGLLVSLEEEKCIQARESVPVVFRRIASIDLPVKDIEVAISFYRDGLGSWVAKRKGQVAVRFGETELTLRSETSFTPICIRVEARNTDFNAAVTRLREHGVEGTLDTADRDHRFFCTDPSGHRVEIVQKQLRHSATLAEIAAYQTTGEITPPTLKHLRDRQPSWVLPFRSNDFSSGGNSGLWAHWAQEQYEHLPWYSLHFDPELAEAIAVWAPLPGKCIELGCGPGTLAARLGSLGYDVTAVDHDELRIRQAVDIYGCCNQRVQYHVGDVLDSERMRAFGTFDYAFDRACFHVLKNPFERRAYIDNCAALLRPKGRLFLKAMSELEPFSWGPCRHSADGIAEMFSSHFRLVEQLVTSFETTLTHQPKAVFCVLERREAWESEEIE